MTILTAGTLATLGLGGGEVGGGAPGQLAGVQAELCCFAPLLTALTIVTLGALLGVGGVEVGGGVGLPLVVRVLVLVVRVTEPPAQHWWVMDSYLHIKLFLRSENEISKNKRFCLPADALVGVKLGQRL